MTEIKNLQIYGIKESIRRSGFPMRTGIPTREDVSVKEIERANSLGNAKSGSGYDNFLKGIIVQFNIKYPQYLSPQLQRYHWFDIVSSQSKMHCLTKGKFKCNKYVNPFVKEQLQKYIDVYNESPTYEHFMCCISNCPMGLEMWMGISTNYLQLKTIYQQRKNHRLEEDWGVVCKMIKELPFSEFICK